MAPIKVEERLKDKLEKRTLTPSSESWSKLSDRLDADDKKSRNPIFWWLGIAAGIIILIAVSIQFFNNDDAQEMLPIIVEEQVKEEPLESEKQNLNETEPIELAIENDVLEYKKEDDFSVEEPQVINDKKMTHKKAKSKTQLADNNSPTIESNTSIQKEELKKEVQIVNDKSLIKEAIASTLNESKTKNTSVTDKEIDLLLKVANKELFKDKLQNETTTTVDANALLMSVEDDMGQSFRTKVFDALKESYETVKTAVAQRNN